MGKNRARTRDKDIARGRGMDSDRDMTETWAGTGTQYLEPQTKVRSSALKTFHATVLKLQNSAV